MSKTTYHISLKGQVGGRDFDRSDVDAVLIANDGKRVNVLIDSCRKEAGAWKDMQQTEARCDFAPNKVRVSYHNPTFGNISLWKKSLYGRTLTDHRATRI